MNDILKLTERLGGGLPPLHGVNGHITILWDWDKLSYYTKEAGLLTDEQAQAIIRNRKDLKSIVIVDYHPDNEDKFHLVRELKDTGNKIVIEKK